jgi:cytochrome P450
MTLAANVLASPRVRGLADLPTPPGLPWLGQALSIRPMRLAGQLEGWARELGTPYRLRLGARTMVVFDDPEAMQRLLRERPHAVSRSRTIEPVFAEMGINGLFSVEGEAWAPQRRLIMQSLNPSHFRGFYPTLRGITERLHRRWHAAARSGQVLEMTEELVRYTVDVTSALAFGEDPNTIEQGAGVIQRHLAAIFPMAIRRMMAPVRWWHWVRLPMDRRLERDLRAVHAYAHDTIRRARERLAAERPEQPRHALEAMLMAADAPGGDMDDATIVANVITLLLGGEDTTAHTLAWTLQFLCADRALQDRMHDEAVRWLGGHAVCSVHDDVRRLDAFEALATEALRLKPVAPVFGLCTRQPVVLGDVALPRGTELMFINRPAMTSARHFGCPMRYDPDRWARGATAHAPGQAHDARAFLQFGAGPRVCPGRHLATVELRLVLSMLLREFTLELACDPAAIEEVTAFTMLPSKMPVRLSLRPTASARSPAPHSGSAGCPHGASRRSPP